MGRRAGVALLLGAVLALDAILVYRPVQDLLANRRFLSALEAYHNKRYDVARTGFEEAAAGGNLDAQTLLASMHLFGQGVPRDAQLAERYARRAAEAGKPDAQFVLGLMYARGLGVPKDQAEGIKWLKRAAAAGDKRALQMLEWLSGKSRMEPS